MIEPDLLLIFQKVLKNEEIFEWSKSIVVRTDIQWVGIE